MQENRQSEVKRTNVNKQAECEQVDGCGHEDKMQVFMQEKKGEGTKKKRK